MSPADDDSQQRASLEAPDTSPLEEVDEVAPLPELGVIGAAAEGTDDATEKPAGGKARSARGRLNTRTRESRPRKKHGGLIAAIVLLLLVMGIVGAAIGSFAYFRWYAYDDVLDFQGTWYVAGTETPIEITADTIQLTESVAYRYKLNTQDKTIMLTLGNMTGYGSYRFSLDRTQLVIFDGQTDANTILEADVRWLVQALYDDFQEEPNDVTAGIRRNRTLLTREPNTTPVPPTASSSTDNPSTSSNRSEGPQTVWSAEDWLNEDGEGGTADDAGSTNTASNANDVGSLLQNINDLPLDDAAAPADAADQAASNTPESTAS